MRRGDVWWVKFGDGRRPGLVLTRDAAIPLLRRVVVVPTTRTIRGIPSEVSLGPADGMPELCVLSCDNIRLVAKSRLTRRITSLSTARLDQVCDALSYALGC